MFRRIPKRNRTGHRQVFTLCRKPFWHPANLICVLDDLLHWLHFDVNPVCDWHDRIITGDWLDKGSADHKAARFESLEPVETRGSESTVTFTGPGSMWVSPPTTTSAAATNVTYTWYPPQSSSE